METKVAVPYREECEADGGDSGRSREAYAFLHNELNGAVPCTMAVFVWARTAGCGRTCGLGRQDTARTQHRVPNGNVNVRAKQGLARRPRAPCPAILRTNIKLILGRN